MPRPMPRKRWQHDAAERFAALDAWRQAHPQATWSENEAAIYAQLAPLQAQLLGDMAMASDAADLRGEGAVCSACAERLHAKGAHRRRPRGGQASTIALERAYARCPNDGSGLSPLDEELGLLPGVLTPTLQDHMSRLGSRLSRGEAASELWRLKGVRVSPADGGGWSQES